MAWDDKKNFFFFQVSFGKLTLARVPSTQYPAIMTPFLLSVHQLSNNSLDRPDCIIPGDASTTEGPMSSKCSILYNTQEKYTTLTGTTFAKQYLNVQFQRVKGLQSLQLCLNTSFCFVHTFKFEMCLKTKGLLIEICFLILSFIALT